MQKFVQIWNCRQLIWSTKEAQSQADRSYLPVCACSSGYSVFNSEYILKTIFLINLLLSLLEVPVFFSAIITNFFWGFKCKCSSKMEINYANNIHDLIFTKAPKGRCVKQIIFISFSPMPLWCQYLNKRMFSVYCLLRCEEFGLEKNQWFINNFVLILL